MIQQDRQSADSLPQDVSEFIYNAEKMAHFLNSAGTKVVPYLQKNVPTFSSLPEAARKAVLHKLATLNHIYTTTLQNGFALEESKKLLWVAMKDYGYRLKSDVMELIDDDTVIEVYDLNHLQIFCNVRFYDFCSYTIEDLFCRPWHNLFSREDSVITERIKVAIENLIKENTGETIALSHIGTHKVHETDSPMRYSYNLTLKYLSPIYGVTAKTRAGGVISLEAAEIVSTYLTAEAEEMALNQYYGLS